MAFLNPATSIIHQLKEIFDIRAGIEDPESIRSAALRLCQFLKVTLEKPETVAFEIGMLPTYTLCNRTAIHLGIYPILVSKSRPATISEIAAETHAEPLLLERILRMLAAMGTVKQIGKNEYEATPITKALVVPSMQAMQELLWDRGTRSMVVFPRWLAKKGLRCPDNPKDGLLQMAFGTKLETFEFWHQQPEVLDNFNTAMGSLDSARTSWLDWFPVKERLFDGIHFDDKSIVLVDVAGGRGHKLEAFQKKYSPAAGRLILEEAPAVIDDIEQLDPKIERVKYNFFEPQPISGARAYYFSHIFHDWPNASCLEILRNTAAAMTKGYSKLLINDMILPDTDCSFLQASYDITMMAIHTGMERSRSQWTALLDEAGFEVVRFWVPPGNAEEIVEAVLKG